MADEIKRAKLKKAAALRAMFNYNIALQRIDFNMDVLQPELKTIEQNALTGNLPEILPINVNEYTTKQS